MKLTGILSTGALPVGEDPVFGTTIAPGLMAPNHEHYFSVRLDMAVDGAAQQPLRGRVGRRAGRAGQPLQQRLADGEDAT